MVKIHALLGFILITGSLRAADVHPKGPEGRPLVVMPFVIMGKTRMMNLVFSCPELRQHSAFGGDWLDDRTTGRRYDLDPSRFPLIFYIRYPFVGHFWQGEFGRIGFTITPVYMKTSEGDFSTLAGVFDYWLNAVKKGNLIQRENPVLEQALNSDPTRVEVDGVPCVYFSKGPKAYPRETEFYCIPFEKDCQIQIEFQMVDNSDRPGLVKSDWRPRGRALLDQIKSSLRIEIRSK